MRFLLTIEEYKERIINLVTDVAGKTINPQGDDWFKMEYIGFLVNECLSNHIMLVDVCNQMYINVFGRDRNGKRWCDENIKQIDQKECDEYNSQKWYATYNDDKWHWPKQYVYPYDEKLNRFNDDILPDIINIESTALFYFKENYNVSYEMQKEVFRRLYGYDYTVDKDFECK